MRHLILSAILSAYVSSFSFAGSTVFTKITTTKLKGGTEVQFDAEGTIELHAGETFNGWTPVFVRPDGTTAIARIVKFDTSTIKPGDGPVVFKIRYVATDPKKKDKGEWKARSKLEWIVKGNKTLTLAHSKKVSVP